MRHVHVHFLLTSAVAVFAAGPIQAQGFAPAAAAGQMSIADGLEVRLVAAEPLIRQPVAIDFDDRGRLWVIQYMQYPNPAELRRVAVDRYSRTTYDRIPDPPPRGPKGADRITILEDTDGNGQVDRCAISSAGSTWRVVLRSVMAACSSSRFHICCSMQIATTTTAPMAIPKYSYPDSAWKTPTRWPTRLPGGPMAGSMGCKEAR